MFEITTPAGEIFGQIWQLSEELKVVDILGHSRRQTNDFEAGLGRASMHTDNGRAAKAKFYTKHATYYL